MNGRFLLLLLPVCLAAPAYACDLCAIYNADSAMGKSGKGFSVAISEQFIPYRSIHFNSRELPPSILNQHYLDRSMTHIVPTWNFSEQFGVSVNLPIVHQSYRRMQLTGTGVFTESGTDTGLGDLSLIGRATAYKANKGQASVLLTLLAGVKVPTGDPEHLREEVESFRELDAIYGPGHQHAVSGVHLRDLTLGSGSFDGVFGATLNTRWRRLFWNAQFQYYLRTEGESGYRIGDEWIISGGPGLFIVVKESWTFSGQALGTYAVMDQDTVLGRLNGNTGMRAIYLGPQLNVTIGENFSVNGGIDVPVRFDNNGLQNLPDYRAHGGVSFRF